MSGAADLMPRIEQARNGHQRAEELLSEARGMLGKPEEQAPPPEEEGGWLDKLKGAGHTLLDAAGFIPVVGAAADLANAAWYAAEGDYTNAAFSAASAVPGVGDAFAASKVAVNVAGATGGVAAAAAFGRRVTNAADPAMDVARTQVAAGREFSIPASRWQSYPTHPNVPQPKGPFRVIDGQDYTEARNAANNANRALHRANPSWRGQDIHEIHPVKFGGSPTDPGNKVVLSRSDHVQFTTWWNRLQKDLGA